MRLPEARAALAALAGEGPPRGGVTLAFDGAVARLALDHPAARSALTLSMMVALADAVAALSDWPGGLVVLSSTDPKAFCAGGYVPELVGALDRPEAAEAMARAMGVVLDALGALPAVSVAALDGLALGGGAELCLAADLRVASDAAAVHFVQARLGIAPGWGGARRLVRRVGRTAALRVLAAAEPLHADAAHAAGLVDHRVPTDAVAGALAWLGGRPPEVLRALKQQVDGDAAEEARAFASVWGGPAHRAARATARR